MTFASLFVALFLVWAPSRLLQGAGIAPPPEAGVVQVAGMAITSAGAALAAWCVLAFAVIGKGTPAPFDPPRRLVARGPYGVVRNPMYVGAVGALAGAALYFRSGALLLYAGAFFLAAHLLVTLYEEPTLARMFGAEYEAYRGRVGRWWPRRARHGGGGGDDEAATTAGERGARRPGTGRWRA